MHELIAHHGYEGSECFGNVAVSLDGYQALSSMGIRSVMRALVTKKLRHKVVLIDEINRVYPARFWSDKDRTMELLSVWQDEKCFHWIIYTTHVGTSVDVLIREATQIILVPKFDREADEVRLSVINSLDLECHEEVIPQVSRFFSVYDRWQPVE